MSSSARRACATAHLDPRGARARPRPSSSARSSTCASISTSGHVERIQTDNGSEFQAQFHWHVLDRGIQHVYIRPATPRLNGKVERSHRIDAEEFYRMLDGVVIDDAKIFSAKLQDGEDFYNFERPHGALGGQTPYERLRQKVSGSGVTEQRQSHS